MAVSFDINSEAYCRKAYLNYHIYGNTMGITASQMGQICQTYSGRLESWQSSASGNDENIYEFDDSEFLALKNNGYEGAKTESGYENSKGGMITEGIGHSAGAIATAGVTLASKCTKATAGKGAEKGAEKGAADALAYVAIALAVVTAAAYFISKPNKEEKEVCDKLQGVMAEGQGQLGASQAEMDEMAQNLIQLSDEAADENEDANNEIEEKKTEYDMYLASVKALEAKANSGQADSNGQTLTEDEKALYKELVAILGEMGVEITERQESATETVGEIYDTMGTYQEGYDNAAETIATVQGETEFAATIDTATKAMCYVEGGAQTLNAASAGIAAGKLIATGLWWNYIVAALGLGAAAASGAAATQQFTWAGEVNNEIQLRKGTEELNEMTVDIYDEELDNYDGWLTGVEDLEIEMPEDIEPVEENLPQPCPAGQNNGNSNVGQNRSSSVTGQPGLSENPEKEDKKEDK